MFSRSSSTLLFAFLALSTSTLAWGTGGIDYIYAIPENPDDFTVIATGRSAGNTNTVITIPTTVTANDPVIGPITLTPVAVSPFAFTSNNLTSVSIGDAVVSIGQGAFLTNSITSLTIGSAVENIDRFAFSDNLLTTVVIPDSVTNIGQGAFDNNNLSAVTIGNGVTDIGGSAFQFNDLSSVTIPDSVINIDGSAFSTNQLEAVTIGGGVESIGGTAFGNNALTIAYFVGDYSEGFDGTMLSGNPLLSTILACDTATGWDGIAFNNGSHEVPVIQSSGVCDGNQNGVMDRLDLDFDLNSPNPGAATVLRRAFSNTSLDITIPSSIVEDGGTFDVTHIATAAFFNLGLASVKIPDSVTSIGNSAFFSNDFTSVVIPASVMGISTSAFAGNPLTSVTIPASTTSIGDLAFSSGTLKTAYFVGDYSVGFSTIAFGETSDQLDILACDTATGWVGMTFSTGTDVAPAMVPVGRSSSACDGNANGVVDRLDLEFDLDSPIPGAATVTGRAPANTSLDVAIPSSIVEGGETLDVTRIGSSAFFNNSLTSVTIPNSVSDIGSSAFWGNSFTSVTIPNSMTIIGNGAFYGNVLTSLVIPESVTDIGDGAFGNNALDTVTIPASTTSIGELAFLDNQLQIVYFVGSYSVDFDSASFIQNSQLTEILACDEASGWEGITFNKGTLGVPVSVSVIKSNGACDDDGDGIVNGLESQIAPQTPTIDRVDYGDSVLTLYVSVPESDLAVTGYNASCTDGSTVYTGSGNSSPITVSGLTNSVAYTCTVTATNIVGTSSASASTAPITPEEPIEQGLPTWLLYEATK